MKIVVGALLLCLVGSAAADEPETAWGKGVSAEQRVAAEAKLDEGNRLFLQNKFREALAAYEQALLSWDHPAIRFNVVRCLIALDRPLDAHENLERALAHGKEPFEEQIYTEALNYQRLLASQIADVEISCTQPGVAIKLDGKAYLTCPGKTSSQAVPGLHVLVAQKPGFETLSKDLVLLPGKTQQASIQLKTLAEATVYETRWRTWKPWAVVIAGAAIGGVGVLVDQQGRSQLEQLHRSFAATCSATECTRAQYDALHYDETEASAFTKNTIGISMVIAGGVVVAAGIVGVIINRPRPVTREAVSVTPAITPHGAGFAVKGAF
jgi:tetratricopeptide (TPR) repeat protein